jgi:hypothetical protein
MNKLVVGIIGATALATTLVLVRQQRPNGDLKVADVLPQAGQGEQMEPVSLERLRAVGF